MATPIGGLSVYLDDDTGRFASSLRQNAQLVEQQSQRMSRSLGGVANSVDNLNRKTRTFEPDAFRALSVSALRAQNSVERLRTSLLAVAALGGGGFAGAFAAKVLTDTADTYSNIQNRIASVVKDQGARIAADREIFAIAQRTRASYEVTAQLFQRLTLSASTLGATQSQILQTVEATQKAMLIAGATTQEAASSATQLSQALGSGRLAGDELRSILENAPILAQAIAKEFGVAVGALKEMGAAGSLTSDRVFKAILNQSGQINEDFARLNPTISSALVTLDNAFTKYIGSMDQSLGASTALAGGIQALAMNLSSLGDVLQVVGASMAALFVSRRLAGGVNNVRASIEASKAEATAQRAAAKEAVDAAREVARIRDTEYRNAEFRRREFEAQPQFKQAPVGLQNAYLKAIDDERRAKERLSKLEDDYNDKVIRRMELEDSATSAAVQATRNVERAKAAVIAREAEEANLIQQRVALEERARQAGGDDIDRRTRSRLYNAMAPEAEGLQRMQALRVQRLDARDSLRDAREGAFNAAGTQDELQALQRVAAAEQALQKVEQDRIATAQRIQQARVEQDKIEREIFARQNNDRERAAAALAAHDQKILRSSIAVAEAKEVEARRIALAAESAATAEERKAARIAALDRQIASSRNAMNAQRGAATAATAAVGTAAAAIPGAAASAARAFGQAELEAYVRQGEALAKVSAAQKQLEAVVQAGTPTMRAYRAAVSGVGAALSGVSAFLGGPLGIALTAATAGWALYEIAQAKAAERAREFKSASEGVVDALTRIAAAQKPGGKALSQEEVLAERARLQTLRKGFGEQAQDVLMGARGLNFSFGPEAMAPIRQAVNEFARAGDDTDKLSAASRRLTNEFVALSASRPDMAPAIKPIVDLTMALEQAIKRANELATGLKSAPSTLDRAIAGEFDTSPRDREMARLRREQENERKIMGASAGIRDLEMPNPMASIAGPSAIEGAIMQAGKEFIDKWLETDANAGQLITAQLQMENNNITAAIDGTVKAFTDQFAEALPTADEIMSSIRSDIDSTRKQMQDAAASYEMAGLYDRLPTGEEETARIKEQITSAVDELNKALGNVDATALDRALQDVGSSLETVRQQVQNSATSTEDAKKANDALTQAMANLSAQGLDLSGPIAAVRALMGTFAGAIGLAAGLKAALGGAGGGVIPNPTLGTDFDDDMDVVKNDKTIRALQGQAVLTRAVAESEKDKTTQTLDRIKKDIRDRIIDEGGIVPEDIEAKARQIMQNNETSKAAGKKGRGGGGGGRKSEEEKFADRLERLIEEGRAGFFTDTDRQLIEELKKIKGEPALLRETVDAIKAGQPIPERAQQVKDALQMKSAGAEYQKIIQQYGTLEQLTPQISAYQEKLNIAMREGGLTAGQASLAFADYVTRLPQFGYIDQMADAFENLGATIGDAFFDGELNAESLSKAVRNLGKELFQLGLQEGVLTPLKNLFRSMMSSGAAGGGGFNIMSLFGFGGGGGGAAATPGSAMMPLYHLGGTVGGGLPNLRSVNPMAFAGAPRFHAGLRTDEMAAVLQKGEKVLTSRDQRGVANIVGGLANMAGGGGGNMEVNVVNQNGSEVKVQKRQTSNGMSAEIMIRDAVLDDLTRNGDIAQALQGMYGNNRMNGR